MEDVLIAFALGAMITKLIELIRDHRVLNKKLKEDE